MHGRTIAFCVQPGARFFAANRCNSIWRGYHHRTPGFLSPALPRQSSLLAPNRFSSGSLCSLPKKKQLSPPISSGWRQCKKRSYNNSRCYSSSTNKEQPQNKKGFFQRVFSLPSYQTLKERKAEYMVQYGATLIVVHELLGISSYLVTYSLLRFGVIDLHRFVAWLGWTEKDLEEKGIPLQGKLVTFAATVLIVKGMDVMGLVPLRWALCLFLTPRVAPVLRPLLQSIASFGRRLRQRLSSTSK
ncbi:hypothetical protein QOT17_021019 [Balamuthia mandrillaris]